MAANHRPLYVVQTTTEGYFVYDICIDNEDTTMEVGLCRSARGPVVPPLHYRPLAVSAGTILGVTPQPPHAALPLSAHHRPMFCHFAGCEGELRDPANTGPPIMLPVGDTTVIRMDTVIYTESFRFEALRLLPGGTGWHVTPLPRPPFMSLFSPCDRVSISSYFVKGTRVWISVAGEGIFSLDADEGAGASWRMEFPEEMDFLEGRALHVPELGGAVVGLTPRDRFLCAYEFDERGVPRWRRIWKEAIPWECYHDGNVPARDMAAGLVYLGKGRFCVSKPVDVVGEHGRVTSQSNTFLVLELRRRAADGELELAKRGTLTYQGEWVKGHCLDRYFIQ
ncbi:unnamed protein product [Urochloa humidicola]